MQTRVQPKISIVMSLYNEEQNIKNAIESIVCQTFDQWELILIDDGSTDKSADICKEFVEKDSRIKFVRNTSNIGLAGSLNRGIRLAKSTFIARADADDINLPDRLKIQYDYMTKSDDIDVLGTGAYLHDQQGKRIRAVTLPNKHSELAKLSFIKSIFFHPSVMIRRRFFERAGYYDESYRRAQDKELWLRGLKTGCIYANVKQPLIEYYTNDNKKEWEMIFDKAKALYMMAKEHKVKNGYRLTVFSIALAVAIKLDLYKPKLIRKIS